MKTIIPNLNEHSVFQIQRKVDVNLVKRIYEIRGYTIQFSRCEIYGCRVLIQIGPKLSSQFGYFLFDSLDPIPFFLVEMEAISPAGDNGLFHKPLFTD